MTYDSANGNQFMVHKGDGKHLIFNQSTNGLFYHNLNNREFCLMETVDENKNIFQKELTREQLKLESFTKSLGHLASRTTRQLSKAI